VLPDALSHARRVLLGEFQYDRALCDAREAQLLAATHRSAHTRARSKLLDLSCAIWSGELDAAEQLVRTSLDVANQDITERALFEVRMAAISMLHSGLTSQVLSLHASMIETYPDAVTFRCCLAGALDHLRVEMSIPCRVLADQQSRSFPIQKLAFAKLLVHAPLGPLTTPDWC
jgi:hypothetical protein